jgi:outer membrane protein TolC
MKRSPFPIRPHASARHGRWAFGPGLALALAASPAHAEPGTLQPGAPEASAPQLASMTLEQALTQARAHHPRIASATAEVAVRRAEADIPRARWEPKVGVTAQGVVSSNNNTSANWLGSKGAVEFPRIAGSGFRQDTSEIDWNVYMSTAVGLGVEQQVWDFGRTAAETAAADAEVDIARHKAEDERLRVELRVKEAYYAVLAARSVVLAAEDALKRASAHADEARAMVLRGLKPQVELDRAEAERSRFEVGKLRAQGGLIAAQGVFAAAVGVDAPALDAAGDPAAVPDMPSLPEALRQGEAKSPALQAAEAGIRAQEAKARAADAALRPEIWLMGTVMGAGGGTHDGNKPNPPLGAGFLPWVPNYYAGLVFSWKIHDGVAIARRDAAKKAEDVARAEAASVRQEETSAIQQAWVDVDVAQRAMPALTRALEAARQNYAQAEARFRAGLGTAVELADAEALRTDAEIELALGRFQVARARARLARVVAEGL